MTAVTLPADCPPIPEGFEPVEIGWQVLTPDGDVVESGTGIVLQAVAYSGDGPTPSAEGT